MNRDTRTTTDRGVSPVIGVILMVAITVVIATMVGSVFLDYADQVSDQPPQAAFEYEQSGSDDITITHVSGDRINNERLRITVGGDEVYPDPVSDASKTGWASPIGVGDTVDIEHTDADEGDTVRIVWQNPSGRSANTLSTWKWPQT
ncbi:type IV pilin [Halonotius terrestris]|uniref:Type IV pilin n=1 Tax=Halonotius terrestris TaxID=2487750 RepID=A0A8J8TAY8_9EURY|nr:type IV pilin N-terminal domain-containing protein [Halonotius terrestris]TQQ79878.1 type IV pilin [Halonotius terrestris]